MNTVQAYFWVLITASLPAVAAYVRAKYFFRFPRRSGQLLMTLPALAVMVAVLPLQEFLRDALALPASKGFWSAVTIGQYAFAAVAFFCKLVSEQRKIAPEELARLADLNKRW